MKIDKKSLPVDNQNFNPLSLRRGRRLAPCRRQANCAISIHSLRVEGDFFFLQQVDRLFEFQSTPSVWRETHFVAIGGGSGTISIHSLRVEGDQRTRWTPICGSRFQSTPSVWRETGKRSVLRAGVDISIHSLRVEGDRTS